MGGCASKDKKDKTAVEEDGTAGGIEGCVSNSMVFLARYGRHHRTLQRCVEPTKTNNLENCVTNGID